MKKYLCFVFIFVSSFAVSACGNEDDIFNGSRMGNDSQFVMEYTMLNTTESQVLELDAGDILDVEVVSDGGEVTIVIQKEDEEPIYESENASTDMFQIAIDEGGSYEVTVIGENAEGSVSVVKRTN